MTGILPIFPEILLLALGVLILVIDLFLKEDNSRRSFLGWFTAGGLLVILLLSLLFARPAPGIDFFKTPIPVLVFGGMLRLTRWASFSKCSSFLPRG